MLPSILKRWLCRCLYVADVIPVFFFFFFFFWGGGGVGWGGVEGGCVSLCFGKCYFVSFLVLQSS